MHNSVTSIKKVKAVELVLPNASEKELAWYNRHEEELVRQYEGMYLVIKGSKVFGAFETKSNAQRVARQLFGKGTCLVQQCVAKKPLRIPPTNRYKPVSAEKYPNFKEYLWYEANEKALLAQYHGRHLVIKDKEVKAAFESDEEACEFAYQAYPPNTFIVHHCLPFDPKKAPRLNSHTLVSVYD